MLKYLRTLYETVRPPEIRELAQVQKMKKYVNYIGLGVEPTGQFLHQIREVDALVAEPAHPLGVGIALGNAQEARERHLGEDQVAGQRELERAEREALRRAQDARRLGRPAGEVSRRSAGASARIGGPWRRASHQTSGNAHSKATTET